MSTLQEQTGTLWRCRKCGSTVCIYSSRDVRSVVCPFCRGQTLKYRGSFENVLGLQSGEAEPN